MKKKSPKPRYVKIRYTDLNIRVAEISMLLMWIVFMGLIPLTISAIIAVAQTKYDSTLTLIMIFVLIPATIIIYTGYLAISRGRRELQKKNRYIKKHGTKVIGEIVSMEHTEAHKEDNKQNFTYSYNVQFKNPEDSSLIVIKTPTVLKDFMMLKETDLPLKVIVYVFEKQTFVESLINPPSKSMTLRKILKYAPYVLGFGAFYSIIIIDQAWNKAPASIIIAFALCFCICIVGAYLTYEYKDRF